MEALKGNTKLATFFSEPRRFMGELPCKGAEFLIRVGARCACKAKVRINMDKARRLPLREDSCNSPVNSPGALHRYCNKAGSRSMTQRGKRQNCHSTFGSRGISHSS